MSKTIIEFHSFDTLPNITEVNYLVISKLYGWQIAYYAPISKNLAPRFNVPEVMFWAHLPRALDVERGIDDLEECRCKEYLNLGVVYK